MPFAKNVLNVGNRSSKRSSLGFSVEHGINPAENQQQEAIESNQRDAWGLLESQPKSGKDINFLSVVPRPCDEEKLRNILFPSGSDVCAQSRS